MEWPKGARQLVPKVTSPAASSTAPSPNDVPDHTLFTAAAEDAILLAVIRSRPTWEREELIATADRLLRWAQRIRMQGYFLALLLEGKLRVTFEPTGEPRFYAIETTPGFTPDVR